ncbi:MAG: hypothetical protein ABIK15_14850 [Pseudomonadota bacterium]
MELRIDERKNIAYIKLSGLLNKRKILEAFEEVVADQDYRKGMGRLWDFMDADLSLLNAEIVESIAGYSIQYPDGINDVKVAFVAYRPSDYRIARMFEALSINANTEIAVFQNLEDAERWMSA